MKRRSHHPPEREGGGEHKLVPTCERFFPFSFYFYFYLIPLPCHDPSAAAASASAAFLSLHQEVSPLSSFFFQPTPFPLSSLSLSLSSLHWTFLPSSSSSLCLAKRRGKGERGGEGLLRCWRVIFFVWPPSHLKENQQNSFTTKKREIGKNGSFILSHVH